MPKSCLSLYSDLSFDFGVTDGTEIRILPEFVDPDDLSFPIPWSNPINVPPDFAYYAQTINGVLQANDVYNRLFVLDIGPGDAACNLWLNPEWTEIFGGCGAKIKVAVRNGSLLWLDFDEGNELTCFPMKSVPTCDCDTEQPHGVFKIDSFAPLPPGASAYWLRFGYTEIDDRETFNGIDSEFIPPWLAANPTLANQWLAATMNASYFFKNKVCLWPGGYIGFRFASNEKKSEFCGKPFWYSVGAKFWPSRYVNDPSLIAFSFPFTNEGNPIFHCRSLPKSSELKI